LGAWNTEVAPVVLRINWQFFHLERERQLDDGRSPEDHACIPPEKVQPFAYPVLGRRRTKAHDHDADPSFESLELAFEEDRQRARLAVVGQNELADRHQAGRMPAKPPQGRKGLHRDADVGSHQPFKNPVDLPLRSVCRSSAHTLYYEAVSPGRGIRANASRGIHQDCAALAGGLVAISPAGKGTIFAPCAFFSKDSSEGRTTCAFFA